ncbi:MAG TPA: glutamate 5-kinase, partial [Erythrobacter sp.]|nr:glutamate 5-kinase [Erythrobacter sp.]
EPGAQFIPEVDDVSQYMDATKGKSTLGTGGMETKLLAANMAQEAGVTTWIAQGEVDHPVSSVLAQTRRSTKILPHPNPLSGWDSWIANRLQMAGSLVISDTLATALSGDRPIRREDVISMTG